MLGLRGGATKVSSVPKFAANLSWLFTELPFERRFDAAAAARALDYAAARGCPRLHAMAGIGGDADIYCANLRGAVAMCGDATTLLIEPISRAAMPGYFLDDFDAARAVCAAWFADIDALGWGG